MFLHRDCYNEDGTPKVQHHSRAKAVAYRKKFSNSKNLRPYHCTHCGYWHLGHHWTVPRKNSQPVWR